jgi:hypothetical protein
MLGTGTVSGGMSEFSESQVRIFDSEKAIITCTDSISNTKKDPREQSYDKHKELYMMISKSNPQKADIGDRSEGFGEEHELNNIESEMVMFAPSQEKAPSLNILDPSISVGSVPDERSHRAI